MDLPLATLMDGPSAAHEAALVRCSTVQWLKYAFVPLPLWSVALIFVAFLSVNVFDLVLWFKMLQLQVDSYVTQPYTAQMQFCRKKSQLTSSCPCTKASQCKAAKPSTMSPVTTSLRRSATPTQGEPGQQSSKCCMCMTLPKSGMLEGEASPPTQSQDLQSLLWHSPPMPGSLEMSRKRDDSTCILIILSRSRDGMQPLPRVNSLRKMWPSVKWVQDLGQPPNAWNLVQKKNLQIDGGGWQSSAWRKKQTVGMSSWQLAKVETQDWTPAMAKVADHRPGSVLAPELWLEDQFRSDQQTSTWKRMDSMADMGWAITFVLFIFSCDILSCLLMFLNTSPTRSDLEKAHLQAGSESLYSKNHAAWKRQMPLRHPATLRSNQNNTPPFVPFPSPSQFHAWVSLTQKLAS